MKSTLTALIALAAMLPAAAFAQADPGHKTPYEANEALELGLSGASIAASALIPKLFLEEDLTAPACGGCDIDSINPLDRPVTGYDSAAARLISDVGLVGLITLPLALSFADAAMTEGGDGLDGFLTDATILTETFAVQFALVQIIKYTVERPRPFTYNPDVPLERKLDYDSTLSFFSGHSSTAFSMAVAYAITYQERHPDEASRFVVWTGALGLAALTSSMRIAGGKHFWTDVLTGALVGTSVGVIIPVLHLSGDGPPPAATAKPSLTPIMLMGTF